MIRRFPKPSVPLCKKKCWGFFFFGPKTNDPQNLNTKVDKRTSQALKGVGGVRNGLLLLFFRREMLANMEKQQL